ncbi:nucleolar gtp-binding protein, partial [Cystoisospora suis]
MAKRGGVSKKKKKSSSSSSSSSHRHVGAAFKKGSSSTNPDRKLPENKKQGFYRSKSTIKLLKMYKSKPTWMREKEGQPTAPARIQPDRRWFGNTRVIDQTKLSAFREALGQAHSDPYSVVLRRSKLPVSLLAPSTPGHTEDLEKKAKEKGDGDRSGFTQQNTLRGSALLSLQSFSDAFGDKRTRKKPALRASSLADLIQQAEYRQSLYEEGQRKEEKEDHIGGGEEDGGNDSSCDARSTAGDDHLSSFSSKGTKALASEEIFKKGTSRRIWGELYKVIDASDVVVQVIDARDPLGTRCWRLERYLRAAKQSKHMILILNKVDLIPPAVARVWLKRLSRDFPTLPFQAKKHEKAVGKLQLSQLLRY